MLDRSWWCSNKRMMLRTIVLLLLLATASCTTVTPPSGRAAAGVTPEMLLLGAPIQSGLDDSIVSEVNLLELTPEMVSFIERRVDPNAGDYGKLRQLLHAIIKEGEFRLLYDDHTRTAAETFAAKGGNCLSFTNMFIAMARHLDLKAEYQEVDIPPDWSMGGQSFILSSHINVFVELEPGLERIVDFNIDDFKTTYEMRRVSDQRARAHHYNNIGVEHMLAGRKRAALAFFRQSLAADAGYSPAWVNLGVLYRRASAPAYAEAAYLQAVAVDKWNMVALSNLGNLYEREGELALADQYRRVVNRHRMRNPYYRYRLAREAFDIGDYEVAIDHLKVAIKHHKHVNSFYYLLGLSHYKQGDYRAAERWLRKAAEVVQKDSLREVYNSKLDLLLSAN